MIAGANAENLLLVIETQRKGADVLTGVRRELADLGIGARESGTAIAAGADAGIREIEKLSRTIDVSSKKDVAALRQSAQVVRELAQAAGLAPAEVQKLATAEAVLEARLKAATQEARAQAAQITGLGGRMEVMSPKVRTAANAMSVLSFSAAGFAGGGTAAVMAAGNLATSLAMLSKSAAIAASATGIGAVLVVLGTLITLLDRASSKTADMTGTLDLIRTAGGSGEAAAVSKNLDAQLEEARGKLAQLKRDKPLAIWMPERKELEAEVKALTKVAADAYRNYVDTLGQEGQRAGEAATARAKAAAERVRQMLERDAEAALDTRRRLSVAVLDLEEARDNDIYTQRRLKIERTYGEEVEKLKTLQISDRQRLEIQQQAYQVRLRSLEALAEENRLLNAAKERENRMTAATQSGNVGEAFQARLDEIEAQKQAEIKSGVSRENAERSAQLRIRALQKETFRATLGDLKTIEEATINSKSRQVRIIGQAAMVLRRIAIGAEAALAAVESARWFAKVPGFLALHQYGSAALAFASGTQLAAAAALGFRESLGGGGSGGGSAGGSGGSAGDRGTFEPREQAVGQGQLHLTLITRNPYGRDEIQNVAYQLNRSGILKRAPIEIPATTGVDRLSA